MRNRLYLAALVTCAAVLATCTNNPYPDEDASRKVLYMDFGTPPKTLDPAVAYSVVDHSITGPVYETLLEYHFLRRPYTLIPGIATGVPEARSLPGGRLAYRFELRDDLLFQDDPCFALGDEGRETRAVRAADVGFELMRIADPDVNSPVVTTFWKIVGMREFGERLARRREGSSDFAALRLDRQYREAGPIEGLQVLSDTEFEIVLAESYPQILFWFAMEFTTPVP